jgi:DNA invertase Pin-like site-specific DNA recombinase
MRIGYARISTEEQNLALQRDALEAAGCDRIFEDAGVSGAARRRPGLDRALAALEPGDTLVIWRFDRLGRSVVHLVSMMAELEARGCAFQSLTEVIDTNTAGGRLLYHVAAAFSQFERDLISERTKAGLAAARKRGVRIGRPRKLSPSLVRNARNLIANDGQSVRIAAAALDVHSSTLIRALRR